MQALEHLKMSDPSPDGAVLKSVIEALRRKAGKAAEKALPYLEQANSVYYGIFEDTITEPFVVPYKARKAHVVDLVGDRQIEYEERVGDTCFADLIGYVNPTGKYAMFHSFLIISFCIKCPILRNI